MDSLRYALESVSQVLKAPSNAMLTSPSTDSPPPIWNLPEDIILHIVDYLAADKASLKTLCLTSIHLKAPCQRYLFSKLIIRSWDWKAFRRGVIGKQLLPIFEGCPAIPHYVKSLEIRDYAGRNANPQWLRDDEELTRALSLLDPNRIEHLALLRGPTRVEDSLDTHFSVALIDILRNICRSDSLRTLTLGWLNRPDVFALCGKCLCHLEVADGICSTFNATKPTPPRHPVRINSLTTSLPSFHGNLAEITRCLLAASTWIDLRHLTRLSIATRDYIDISHALLLVNNCAPSLEELYISTPQNIHRHARCTCPLVSDVSLRLPCMTVEMLDLSRLTNLRYAEISCLLDHLTCHAQNCRWAVRSLRTLASAGVIERISFRIVLFSYESSEPSLGGLKELDELLDSNTQFPNLARVSIHIGLCGSTTAQIDALSSDIHERLPRLRAARLLNLTRHDGHA